VPVAGLVGGHAALAGLLDAGGAACGAELSQGDRASGGTKPATLETGATINVPLFINEGDLLKIDTREGKYLERVRG